MMRRQLGTIIATPSELKALDFIDLIRRGPEAGLVSDVQAWHGVREIRNRTSHTYDASSGERVVASLDEFVAQMHFLLDELRRRNDAAD